VGIINPLSNMAESRILKPRGVRESFDTERRPPIMDVEHFGKTKGEIFANAMWREDFFRSKLLNMAEDIKFWEFQTRTK